MIVVDTSALITILLEEPRSEDCMSAMDSADGILMSAGTLVEALIVSRRRGIGKRLSSLLSLFEITVAPVSESFAVRVGDAYDQWGKGIHPAGLNMGDCYAYALSCAHDCPLLFVGADFAKTDVKSVLA